MCRLLSSLFLKDPLSYNRQGWRYASERQEVSESQRGIKGDFRELCQALQSQVRRLSQLSISLKRTVACSTLFSSAVSVNLYLRIDFEGTSLVRRIEGLASNCPLSNHQPLTTHHAKLRLALFI